MRIDATSAQTGDVVLDAADVPWQKVSDTAWAQFRGGRVDG